MSLHYYLTRQGQLRKPTKVFCKPVSGCNGGVFLPLGNICEEVSFVSVIFTVT